jgi:hypothetical protein
MVPQGYVLVTACSFAAPPYAFSIDCNPSNVMIAHA